MKVRFRTECNGRSKYFDDLAAAYGHFFKCVVMRRSVELWAVYPAKIKREKIMNTTIQELADSFYLS